MADASPGQFGIVGVLGFGDWQKMRYVITRTRTAARVFGIGGMASYAVLVGPRAQLRLTDRQPAFEIAVPENAQPESYLTSPTWRSDATTPVK